MIVELKEKIVFVTGAASGIGAAVARLAAASGAAGLYLVDRDGAGAAALADDLSGLCPAEAHSADLIAPGAGGNCVGAAISAFGRVDAVLNAAALTDRASVAEGSVADWDGLFAVNARAPFEIMQGAIRDMQARGQPGGIVNILSINVHCGLPDLALYSASKAALATLTKNAANAHMAEQIRVNGINLGWADTPGERRMQAETLGKGAGWLAEVSATRPLGRLLIPEEVARHVIWLMSDASAPMSGVCFDLDQTVVGAP